MSGRSAIRYGKWKSQEVPCPVCGGKGLVIQKVRRLYLPDLSKPAGRRRKKR